MYQLVCQEIMALFYNVGRSEAYSPGILYKYFRNFRYLLLENPPPPPATLSLSMDFPVFISTITVEALLSPGGLGYFFAVLERN